MPNVPQVPKPFPDARINFIPPFEVQDDRYGRFELFSVQGHNTHDILAYVVHSFCYDFDTVHRYIDEMAKEYVKKGHKL